MDRAVVPGEARRQSDVSGIRTRHSARLSGARRAVRELVRAPLDRALGAACAGRPRHGFARPQGRRQSLRADRPDPADRALGQKRSEEHTSELQSRQYLVCRLLLEKKKKTYKTHIMLNT